MAFNASYSRLGDPRHSQSPTTSFSAGRKFFPSRPQSGYSTPGAKSTVSNLSIPKNVGCFAGVRMTATAKLNRFFRRLINIKQMDFEFAAWQMLYLLTNPQQVYRNFIHRKRTKDQWARDDPAFLVLLAFSLSLTSILFAFVLNLSFAGFLKFFLWIVFVDCIGVGLVIATFAWFVTNKFLRRVPDQDVEWGYCWDVHLNAFFPMFVFIHVIMPLLFYGLIDYTNFFSRLLGNSMWCVATFYYVYLTFLGYTALPILKKTHVFLYPLTFIFIFFVATVAAGWNISQTAMDFYHFRATNTNRRL
ncbi:unnamed protein product [Bursaphelenchus xylophilus]|uniref:(pine wood nematode) hypothetical protein n=1 Tax=Bursaphelenchus xylophilus TaxID=6326 RepID=A0A7I8WMH5_BURXY|nr:unnamed protein product [Bursaphelenchus xylophilus]CAG9104033.1 unnamed protein product [Bursaphelenchus xylophilus]